MVHECKNEARLRELEKGMISANKDIEALVSQLKNLTCWVKSLVIVIMSSMVGAFGYLLVYWVKGG